VVTRKKGDRWIVGGIANDSSRILAVDMTFLVPGKSYTAIIYTDEANTAGNDKKGAC